MTVSRSPIARASALGARAELDRLLVALVEHRQLRARADSAIASSRLSGNASSSAIARSAAAVADGASPAHQWIRDSQRSSSPARSPSPAATWSSSSARRASSARSMRAQW